MGTPRLPPAAFLAILFLSLFVSPIPAQPGLDARQRAVAAIQKLGGSIYDDPQSHGVNVYLSRTRVSDDDLRLLQAVPSLRRLNLDDTEISDAGLKHLKALPALQEVSLYRTNVTEAGAQDLRKARPGLIVLHSPKPPAFRPARLLVLLILFPFFASGVFLLGAGLFWQSKPGYLRVRAAVLGAGLILVCMLLAVIAVLQATGFDLTLQNLFG